MNKQTLSLVTVVAALLLIFALASDDPLGNTDATGGTAALYPDLLDEINGAREITLVRGDTSMSLTRSGDTWGLASKHGYPVKIDEVRKTLVGLARLTVLDAKTSNPELHDRLAVQNPGAGNDETRRITVHDKDANILVDLIVGKRRGGAGDPSHYVRRAGENESWLVKGNLDFTVVEASWLDKQILKVSGDRVQSVRVVHEDGEVLLVVKSEPGQTNYNVHDIPEGSTLRYETIANAMGTALNYLNFTDVIPATELGGDITPEATTTYTCFEGLMIVVDTFTREDKPYARFRATVSEISSDGMDVPEAADNEGEGTERTALEAAEIQAKVGGWAFEISPYTQGILARRMADLVNTPLPEDLVILPPDPLSPTEAPEETEGPEENDDGGEEDLPSDG